MILANVSMFTVTVPVLKKKKLLVVNVIATPINYLKHLEMQFIDIDHSRWFDKFDLSTLTFTERLETFLIPDYPDLFPNFTVVFAFKKYSHIQGVPKLFIETS